jgi:death-on-curing protein
VDGNKRTAFVVAYVFLLDNGYDLTAADQQAVTVMLSVANGLVTEADLATWFRVHIREASAT